MSHRTSGAVSTPARCPICAYEREETRSVKRSRRECGGARRPGLVARLPIVAPGSVARPRRLARAPAAAGAAARAVAAAPPGPAARPRAAATRAVRVTVTRPSCPAILGSGSGSNMTGERHRRDARRGAGHRAAQRCAGDEARAVTGDRSVYRCRIPRGRPMCVSRSALVHHDAGRDHPRGDERAELQRDAAGGCSPGGRDAGADRHIGRRPAPERSAPTHRASGYGVRTVMAVRSVIRARWTS